eukprot:15366112-Ditylum_brightwellii.AAC.2
MGYQAGRQCGDENLHDQSSFVQNKGHVKALLSRFVERFIELLPTFFKAIMGIMFQHTINKNKGRHNDQEHHRQPSLYGYGGSNIPTFFGIAITQGTLLNYVSKLKDGNSVTLTTSRIFLQPYIPDNMDDIIFPARCQNINTLIQTSLHRMECLHLRTWMDHVPKESLQLHKFRWMLPINHHQKKFLFFNETHYASMLGLEFSQDVYWRVLYFKEGWLTHGEEVTFHMQEF